MVLLGGLLGLLVFFIFAADDFLLGLDAGGLFDDAFGYDWVFHSVFLKYFVVFLSG